MCTFVVAFKSNRSIHYFLFFFSYIEEILIAILSSDLILKSLTYFNFDRNLFSAHQEIFFSDYLKLFELLFNRNLPFQVFNTNGYLSYEWPIGTMSRESLIDSALPVRNSNHLQRCTTLFMPSKNALNQSPFSHILSAGFISLGMHNI